MSLSQVAARVGTSPLDFPPHVNSCTRHLLGMVRIPIPLCALLLLTYPTDVGQGPYHPNYSAGAQSAPLLRYCRVEACQIPKELPRASRRSIPGNSPAVYSPSKQLVFPPWILQLISTTQGSNLARFPRGDVRTKVTYPWFWYTGPGLQTPPSIELRPTSPLRVRKQPSSYGLREMADGQKVGRVGNQGRPRYRHARSMTTDDMKARRAAVFYE